MDMLPEQILFDRTNNLRIELEGKIEKKIDSYVFWSILAILISVLLTVFAGVFYLILRSDDNTAQIKEQLIRVESKLDNKKH